MNARIVMSRKHVISAIAGSVVVIAGSLIAFHYLSTVHAAAGVPPAVTSALVKTALPRQIDLSEFLPAFGDVTTGQIEAVSFPRAGQVSRLLVLPGQRVRRGTPLATLTSDPTARLAYAQASSAVNFANGEMRRVQELFSLQLATQSQVDAAGRVLRDAQANLATQHQLGGDIGSATVIAPFDGVVTAVTVAQGDRLLPGAAILQLGHADVLRVQLGIEPNDSHLVRAGMPVTLSPVDDSAKTVLASISENQGVVDPKTQLINAVVELHSTGAKFLVPGMHVRGMIDVGHRMTWAVPRSAVLTDAAGAYVFQVAGGKAHRVNVTQGEESKGMVAISGNIDPTLPIVVLGNYELQDGMVVREGGA